MHDRTRIETLLAELDADIGDLGGPVAANRKAAGRNLYGSRLDPDRVRGVQSRVPSAVAALRAAHDRFSAALRIIAEALD